MASNRDGRFVKRSPEGSELGGPLSICVYCLSEDPATRHLFSCVRWDGGEGISRWVVVVVVVVDVPPPPNPPEDYIVL